MFLGNRIFFDATVTCNRFVGMGEEKDMVGFAPDGSSSGFYASSRSSPRSHSSQTFDLSNLSNSDRERFSRKVFVGGLPPDIDEGNFSDILYNINQ